MAGTTEVARLRYTLVADAGGLRAGLQDGKEGLKDFGRQVGRADSQVVDWKGLEEKSARSLKFVGRKLGGVFKGALGDVIGIASAGAAMGPMGAGIAAGAAMYGLVQSHQDELAKQRTDALQSFREARKAGISADTYRDLKAVAGDDAELLGSMAKAMKELKDSGPNASAALKEFGTEIQDFKLRLGIKGDSDAEKKQLTLAGEKHLEQGGAGATGWGELGYNAMKQAPGLLGLGLKLKEFHDDTERAATVRDYYLHKYKQEGIGDAEAKRRAEEKYNAITSRSLYGNRTDKYTDTMAEFEKDTQGALGNLEARSGLLTDSNLKTNREKLSEKLQRLAEVQNGITSDAGLSAEAKAAYNEKIGRATHEAMGEYQQGGAPGMAAAMTSGSVAAYSTIANATIGESSHDRLQAEANEILSKISVDLKDALNKTRPDWKTADTA